MNKIRIDNNCTKLDVSELDKLIIALMRQFLNSLMEMFPFLYSAIQSPKTRIIALKIINYKRCILLVFKSMKQ